MNKLLLSLFLITSSAFAQTEDELADAGIHAMRERIEAVSAGKRLDCRDAFGNVPFCQRIVAGLPLAFSFTDYIAITIRSKYTNGYDKLEPRLQAAYDTVKPLRERCVAGNFR